MCRDTLRESGWSRAASGAGARTRIKGTLPFGTGTTVIRRAMPVSFGPWKTSFVFLYFASTAGLSSTEWKTQHCSLMLLMPLTAKMTVTTPSLSSHDNE